MKWVTQEKNLFCLGRYYILPIRVFPYVPSQLDISKKTPRKTSLGHPEQMVETPSCGGSFTLSSLWCSSSSPSFLNTNRPRWGNYVGFHVQILVLPPSSSPKLMENVTPESFSISHSTPNTTAKILSRNYFYNFWFFTFLAQKSPVIFLKIRIQGIFGSIQF